MKKRQLHFSCTDNACNNLAKVISAYTHAAFPLGGSECAQATRESLLHMASRLADCEDENFAINTRQRPMLKSSVKWYFSEIEINDVQRDTLLQRISGK